MKKIFILLFFSTSCYAQTEFNDLTKKTSTTGSDQITVVNGAGTTTGRASKDVFQEGVRDSINDNIDSLALYRIDIDNNSDSINTLWSLVDFVGPVIDSASILISDTIIIYWDETVSGSADTSMFEVLVSDEPYTDISIFNIGSQTRLKLNQSVLVGATISVSYFFSATGIQDRFGNLAAASSNVVVTNRLVDTYATLLAFYDYEGNGNDSHSTNDATTSTSMTFLANDPITGDFIGDFTGSTNNMTLPSLPFGPRLTITTAFRALGYTESRQSIAVTDDFGLYLDAVEGKFFFEQINGTDTTTAESNDSIYVSGRWMHVVCAIDTIAKEAHFWVNARDQDYDSIVDAGFDYTDSLQLGLDKNGLSPYLGYMDATKIYDGEMVQLEVDSLFAGLGIQDWPIDREKPTPDTANVGNVAFTILDIIFDEELLDITPDTAAFAFTQDGSPITEFDPVIIDNMIRFSVDTITGGSTLSVVYTATGINDVQDIAGNTAVNFTQAVGNTVTTSDITQTAHYKMNGTPDDDLDNYNGVAGGGFTYSTSFKVEGSSGGDMDGSNRFLLTPSIDFDSVITAAMWFIKFGSDTSLTLMATDGWKFAVDNVNGHLLFFNYDNDGQAESTGVYDLEGEFHHAGFVLDTVNELITFYIDGDSINTASTLTGINMSSVVRFGTQIDGAKDLRGYMDDIMLYGGGLSSSQFLTIYSVPGVMVEGVGGGGGGVDPPTNPDPAVFVTYYVQDFEDNDLGWYDQTTFQDDWPGTVWRDSNPANSHNGNADSTWIVDEDTYRCMRVDLAKDVVSVFPNYDCFSNIFNLGHGDSWKHYIFFTIEDELDEVYLSFNFKADPNMDWDKGGKFPTLTGGPSGGAAATKPGESDGWTANLTWGGTSNLKFYLGHQDVENERYNSSHAWNYTGTPFRFTNDVWYNITMRWVNNTFTNGVSNADGFIEGWIDGVLRGRVTGLRWTSDVNEGRGFNMTEFAHYRGGCSVGFMSSIDAENFFDDYYIFKYVESGAYPGPHELSDPDNVLFQPWTK